MEIKQNGRLSRHDFDKLTREIRAIVGSKLKEHKEGDFEEALSEQLN